MCSTGVQPPRYFRNGLYGTRNGYYPLRSRFRHRHCGRDHRAVAWRCLDLGMDLRSPCDCASLVAACCGRTAILLLRKADLSSSCGDRPIRTNDGGECSRGRIVLDPRLLSDRQPKLLISFSVRLLRSATTKAKRQANVRLWEPASRPSGARLTIAPDRPGSIQPRVRTCCA